MNPYESPLQKSQERDITVARRHRAMRFFTFGVSSGVLSWSLVFIPVPLRLLLPPFIFAFAVCVANGKLGRECIWVYAGFELAWMASLLAGFMSLSLSNGWFAPYGTALLGCSSGAVGSLFVAITYMVNYRKTASCRSLWTTVVVGSLAGWLGLSLDVCLNDNGAHLFASGFIVHAVWQPSVVLSLLLGEYVDNRLA